MQASSETGVCPSCDLQGFVGEPCPERGCRKRGVHFVPAKYAEGQPEPEVGTRIDNWLLVKVLGAGGFGKVFLALQVPILLRAALKLLHAHGGGPEMARRMFEKFEGEARALASLSHPNIVRLLQYGLAEDQPFLVMEFVEDARTLKDEIAERAARGQVLTAGEARRILGQVIDGLEAGHDKGIVHRDIKPENIMLQRVAGNPSFVRIVDFGLAKDLAEGNETSVAMGTPVYMAPEQLDRRNLGPWTDWYAVGVMAFELMTGRRPFSGRTQRELLARKLDPAYDPTTLLADLALPEPTLAFFRRALARDPESRFRNAPQFRDGLARAVAALDGSPDHAGARSLASVSVAALAQDADREHARERGTTGTQSVSAAPGVHRQGGASGSRRGPLLLGALVGVGGIGVALAIAIGSGSGPDPTTTAKGSDATGGLAAVTMAGATTAATHDTPDVGVADVGTPADAAASAWNAPAGMVLVRAGRYPIGCQADDAGCWPDEKPGRLTLIGAFAIGESEVTNGEYAQCVTAGRCPAPATAPTGCSYGKAGKEALPVACVTWDGARAYCRFRGWRLPTEGEWEAAARGRAHPDFPWGNEAATCDRAVIANGCGSGGPQLAGAREADRAWSGALDLGGNLREWTASDYAAYPGGEVDPETRGKVNRGASWIMQADHVSTAHTRTADDPARALPDIGFRCAVDGPR